MTTFIVYCNSCDKEAPRSFFCSECDLSYCEDCVGEAESDGEGFRVFRCAECGTELFFHLPLRVPKVLHALTKDALTKMGKPSAARSELSPRKRASRLRELPCKGDVKEKVDTTGEDIK